MTEPSAPQPADQIRAAYDRAAAAVTELASVDSLAAFEQARALLDELERLISAARELRDGMVLRVREDRQLSLTGLAEVLRWGVSRPRMQQIIDRARAQGTPTEPPAA